MCTHIVCFCLWRNRVITGFSSFKPLGILQSTHFYYHTMPTPSQPNPPFSPLPSQCPTSYLNRTLCVYHHSHIPSSQSPHILPIFSSFLSIPYSMCYFCPEQCANSLQGNKFGTRTLCDIIARCPECNTRDSKLARVVLAVRCPSPTGRGSDIHMHTLTFVVVVVFVGVFV